MKKIIIIVSMLIFSVSQCLSQETDSINRPMSKQDYLQKSKRQRTGGFVFMGLGVALDIAGIITTISNANKELGDLFTGKTNVDHSAEYILYIAGTTSLLSSIPMFISASRNKKRSLKMSFINQPVQQLANSAVYRKPMAALSIRLNL